MADSPIPPNPSNPYAAPTATVSDQATADFANGEFEPTGLTVPAGRGWDWIKRGWRLFRAQMGLWIGITITFFILCVGIQILPIIGFLISFFMTPILLAGIMIGCRKLDQGGRMAFADLFAAFSRNVGQLVFLGVLELLILIALMGITYLLVGDMGQIDAVFQRRGSSLPAGPGVALMPLVMMALAAPYLAAVWFAPALVVFNNFAAPMALLTSLKVSLRNWLPFTVYGLAGIALLLPLMIVMGVGIGLVAASALSGSGAVGFVLVLMAVLIPLMFALMVFLTPIMFGTLYASYRDCFYRNG